jgi:signal transduction histidine kinase
MLLLSQAERDLQHSLDDLRQLAHGIHPVVLTDLGLANAITTLAARSTLPVRLVALPLVRYDDAVEATAYYLVAEALTNVHRHAHASTVLVRIVGGGGELRVDVEDDGVGGADERPGSGLQGLRHRLADLGGTLAVESPTGGGTRLAAAIPAVERV